MVQTLLVVIRQLICYPEQMSRKKHPNKHIEEALQYAESKGWKIEKSA